jgi:hypothetical protein
MLAFPEELSMVIQYWTQPVDVVLEGWNHRRTITATCFACECLLTLWPDRRGPAYFKALRACAAAMQREDQTAARNAFIDAAREARVLIH